MLVLASGSPRRRELLTQAGFTFTVSPASIDEDLRPGENPFAYVTRLAREKAQAVAARADLQDDAMVVLGADTTVVAPNGEILGKPTDEADAAHMLRMLSGATHQVITGVAVVSSNGVETAAEVTHVSMLTLSDEEIVAYLALGESMDKAGAYGIQGYAGRWVPRVHGCYFNVMGLPLALVCEMLEGVRLRSGQLV
jgi:nucleoside triphosphate pyrophosphatase